MKKITIGCIGLGLMGKPVAINLIKAGYKVSVYSRREESSKPLAELGCQVYDSPKALAQHCQVLITNVSDSSDVEAVLLGENGAIEGLKAGSIVLDMSTISPDITRRIASELNQRDIEMLDAPVSGGPQGAESALLSIMVGGKKEVFESALPILQCVGKNIVHIGDNGAGQVAKACNQLIVAQTMTAISEAFVLAKASNVDPSKVRDALMGGFAGSRILEVHGQRMLSGDYTPGFKSKLHQKDLNIIMQEADKLGLKLESTKLSQLYMNSIKNGELDSSAIYSEIEKDNLS